MSDSYTTVLPSAGRLMSSLRDIGYDLPSAISDLVDNALDARALTVNVEVVAEGPNSWVRVSDDGVGMSALRLDEAMRYGTRTAYAEHALGHFGLGLKTASLSQCRRLTVASREVGSDQITIRRWDLDEVLTRDSWDLEQIPIKTAPERALGPLSETGHGTVVVWEHLDRILPRRPTVGMTARVLRTAGEEIRGHLEMVFHRFLDGVVYSGHDRLTLSVNGDLAEAWDPFVTGEAHTQALPPQVLDYEDTDGRLIAIDVRPYVVPGQLQFSSLEAHSRAGGPRRWNRHQGFYVYRRDRLIQAGGWNRLRTLDEHAKLARLAVDLPLGDEDRFAVNVAKMRVTIPEELRPGLRAIAAGAVSVAQERYRDHIDDSGEPLDQVPSATDQEAISLSRDWPAILAAVEDVLGDNPLLRDRLLMRLANADPHNSELLARAG